MEQDKKQSLLEQILEKGVEFIKKPFVIKRVNRAFETAADQLEEQLMDNEAAITKAREELVNAAKNEGNLSVYLNKLIELQSEKINLEDTKKALAIEKDAFLGTK